MKLNRETSAYVYQLMSMKEIIEKPTVRVYHKKPKHLFAQKYLKSICCIANSAEFQFRVSCMEL